MIQFFESHHRMMPGVNSSIRATAVSTAKGVVLISPFEFSARQLSEIRALGEVVALVHPNLHHSAYAAQAKAQFPRAELWGAEGLPEKKPAIQWARVLGRDSWPFAPELEALTLRGANRLNETVFFHPATHSLIVMDLAFNMRQRMGWLTPLTFRLFGIYKRFAVASFLPKLVDDRAAFAASLREMLNFNFDRLIMAHGEIISSGARTKLEQALQARDLL